MSDSNKQIQKYADVAMFKAQEQPKDGPKVYLLSCNSDPLGSVAAAAKAYVGEFVSSLAEITDDERRYYLKEIQKTALAMPLEAVNFQFRITGVTRGFTHQMVRQRTAAYSQESTRFAVKDTVPVGDPPSIAGAPSRTERAARITFLNPNVTASEALDLAEPSSPEEKWRDIWDAAVEHIEKAYNLMVDTGMPAEDARGILPTNLLTQLNYHTNLRNFIEEGGKRLCTQAQFEWRIVFSEMVKAIRAYGANAEYSVTLTEKDIETMTASYKVGDVYHGMSSQWQFDALADLFRPVCYLRGKCQFNASFDRACTIKERVEQNASIQRPSSEWYTPGVQPQFNGEERRINPIFPAEWLLDPAAARVSQ